MFWARIGWFKIRVGRNHVSARYQDHKVKMYIVIYWFCSHSTASSDPTISWTVTSKRVGACIYMTHKFNARGTFLVGSLIKFLLVQISGKNIKICILTSMGLYIIIVPKKNKIAKRKEYHDMFCNLTTIVPYDLFQTIFLISCIQKKTFFRPWFPLNLKR